MVLASMAIFSSSIIKRIKKKKKERKKGIAHKNLSHETNLISNRTNGKWDYNEVFRESSYLNLKRNKRLPTGFSLMRLVKKEISYFEDYYFVDRKKWARLKNLLWALH